MFKFVITIDDDALINSLMKRNRWAPNYNLYRVFNYSSLCNHRLVLNHLNELLRVMQLQVADNTNWMSRNYYISYLLLHYLLTVLERSLYPGLLSLGGTYVCEDFRDQGSRIELPRLSQPSRNEVKVEGHPKLLFSSR